MTEEGNMQKRSVPEKARKASTTSASSMVEGEGSSSNNRELKEVFYLPNHHDDEDGEGIKAEKTDEGTIRGKQEGKT